MKIAYFSMFTDGTGYSHAGTQTVLAMDKVGMEVVPRTIKLTSQVVQPPERILELERNSNLDGVDVLIQHTLPHLFIRKGGVKNIGYFHVETSNIDASCWQTYANLMDEIWVSSEHNKECLLNTQGFKTPVEVVPIPCREEVYAESYAPLDIPTKGKYVFYTIADWSYRKNLDSIIRAYTEAFGKNDQVILVMKTYIEGHATHESNKKILEIINEIRASINKNSIGLFPPIVIINEYLTDYQIMQLHSMGDCYVSAERGAGWNIPAMDAIGMDNWVIATNYGGQIDFLNSDNSYLLDHNMESCYGMKYCPYKNLYTPYEQWSEPNFEHLKSSMASAYHNRPVQKGKSDLFDLFGLDSIGQKIKGIMT